MPKGLVANNLEDLFGTFISDQLKSSVFFLLLLFVCYTWIWSRNIVIHTSQLLSLMAEKERASETLRTFNTSITSKHMYIRGTLKGIIFLPVKISRYTFILHRPVPIGWTLLLYLWFSVMFKLLMVLSFSWFLNINILVSLPIMLTLYLDLGFLTAVELPGINQIANPTNPPAFA